MLGKINSVFVTLVLVCLFPQHAFSQANANVEGLVKDSQTGEPLPSANVFLVGTGFGASADMDGRYVIRNVPGGSYTLRVSYIGYRAVEETLEVKDGGTVTRNFKLEPAAVEGQVIVVTAQAHGQKEAINQQLASNQIANVVSSARIQELPDANAAEAIGRLPGISILRSGGEGTQVVVRGLQPKYNVITIDGVRMASSNPFDRSSDLSMISPYSLEGIEVTKAVTADQDADVLGGTVNFKMREARGEQEGFGLRLIGQSGFNGLSNSYNKSDNRFTSRIGDDLSGNYKFVVSGEGRFFDSNFGIFAQADVERKNLTSNEFGAAYSHLGDSPSEYITQGLNLNDVPRDRKRINGTLVLDCRLPDGKVALSNFLSSGTTDIHNRGEFFDIQNNLHNYSLAYSQSTLSVISNALGVEYEFSPLHVNAKVSHSYSETKSPGDWTVQFQQLDQGLGQFFNVANLFPQNIPKAATIDTAQTFLVGLVTNGSFSRERALTASLDMEMGLNISDVAASTIKFGGKYRRQTRSYLYDQSGGQGLGLASARFVDSLIVSRFPWISPYYDNASHISVRPFIDPAFSYGTFLEGDYPMVMPLTFSMLSEMVDFVKSRSALLAQRNDIAYFHDNFNSTTNNYTGYENQSALYVMAIVNIGQDMTVIPGIRYQDLQTTYTASRGVQNSASLVGGPYFHYDTTVTVGHAYWLPSVVLRYKPLEWFDIRMSYTNTLAYPDYFAIVPRIDVSTIGTIAWNNSQLVPSRSRNYDAYLSFYDNSIGLFTIGGFLKQIDDLIYAWNFYVSGVDALPYFPPGLGTSVPTGTYNVSTYVNDPYRINNWGLECDWQTHFWYLPQPLDGLVLNINYTHVYSRAEYPYSYIRKVGRLIEYVDTSFTDKLLYQPNDILNISAGYDYAGFSIRLSMLYQAEIFTGPNFWPQLRTTTSAYRRWDLSVKQDLGWMGLQIYGDINNINGAKDVRVINAATGVPQSQQLYGLTADVGLRWQF